MINNLILKESGSCTKPKGRHLPIPIGFCQDGSVKELDVLETCPYRLYISGVPGSGKSTLLQNIVANGALRYSPDELIYYLLDADNQGTFDCFRQIPHVKMVSSSDDASIAKDVLEWFVKEENKRIALFRDNDVSNIECYNEKAIQGGMTRLPYCFFIIDDYHRVIGCDRNSILVNLLGKGGSHITGIAIIIAGPVYSMISDDRIWRRFVGTKIALKSDKNESITLLGNDKATLLDGVGCAIVNTTEYDEEGEYNEEIHVANIDGKIDLPVIIQMIEEKYGVKKV